MVWRNKNFIPENGQVAGSAPAPSPDISRAANEVVRRRVLVVDDDDASRVGLADFLCSYGYETLTAADGHEALRLLTAEPVDLVVLDLNMPGMSGYELMRQKRTLPAPARDVPVVICSAAPSQFIRGVEAVFTKPVRMLELLGALDRTIGPGKSWPQKR